MKQTPKNMEYSGKVVWVTGGANGIGAAIAFAYHKQGATVVIADKDEKNGKKMADHSSGFNYYFVVYLWFE